MAAYNWPITVSASFGDLAGTLQVPCAGNNPVKPAAVMPAGIAGSLTTTTDGTHGIWTCSGHGLTGSEVFALTWATGQVYGCTITAHDANTVTFTVGAGTTLPTAPVAMTLGVRQQVTVSISGTALQGILATSPATLGLFVLSSSGPTVQMAQPAGPNAPYIWPQYVGQTHPFTGPTTTAVTLDCYNTTIVGGTLTVGLMT